MAITNLTDQPVRDVPSSPDLDRGHSESPNLQPATEAAVTSTGGTIIIPTFNECENISQVIAICLKVFPVSQFDVEVVIVDDDSDDYTWQYPPRLFGHDPRVRVIRRQTSDKGLAKSVTNGFDVAKYEYCAVIDADLQHPPEKLVDLFRALDRGADIAIGSRYVSGGGIENWSVLRKLVSKGATVLARIALPNARYVSDPLSGFFAVRRSVVGGVTLSPQGYKILLEILGKGSYETIVEVPYVFSERERGESNLTATEYRQFLEHLGQLAFASRGFDVTESDDTKQVSDHRLL
nr:polyprenol monophosphomannose synthase [Natrinema gelatinilyticum]